jgi:signal transduction histidine kinase
VQFYGDGEFLADRVASFFARALAADGAAIAIARPSHLELVEKQLRAREIDVDRLRAAGRLRFVEAERVLAEITRGERHPEGTLFHEHVGALVREVRAAAPGPLHAYGEMVDILWGEHRHDAVIRLEQLWDELIATTELSLLCGYQISRFDSDTVGFDGVCAQHDEVSFETGAYSLAQLEQRARALEVEVERRRRLENRMLELLDYAAQLGTAQTPKAVAKITIDAGMKAVGAIAATLWVISKDRSRLELLAASAEVEAKYRTIELRESLPSMPLVHAVREGKAVFLGSRAEYAERYPESYARVIGTLTPSQIAFAMLPVAGDGQAAGVICFTYDHERVFGGPERTFKAIVARHCGLALDRVYLIEQERLLRRAAEAAHAESELLYSLTSEVAVADDLDTVYDIALHTVERGARCDRSAILLFDPDGVMRFKASHGLSEHYRTTVEGHSPWTADEPSPRALAVNDTETDPDFAAYRDVFRAEGLRSLAFVPLVHRKRLVGKFMLYRNEPHAFTSRDLQLASTVAFHVAESIARRRDEQAIAQALAEERAAHAAAEEATRAREEILSVVSHDLRNPLGAILIGASSLLQIDNDRGHRISGIAARMHRQAERMARLIEDLVDFAGIQAGKLALERDDHSPNEIISAASDIFTPLAQERGLTLQTRIQPGLPPIKCDSERAVQVISNLMSNAIKVTPRGGQVSIGAEARDTDVVFFVHDDGPGIDDKELPNLFERYWRGKTSPYRGAGLGLSIARGIVDAHGGKIWAESKLGVGSTFYFSLCGRN